MPQEIKKFSKLAIAHLQLIGQRHQKELQEAIDLIGADLGIPIEEKWLADLQNNQFTRELPVASPRSPNTSTPVAPPRRDIPVSTHDENGVKIP